MRTVDDFAALRRAHREGLSIRQIAKQFGVGRDTVRKALKHPEPPPYTCSQPRLAPVFGPFQPIVDGIVAADEQAPRKQRHTASQLFRRLRDEYGYTGGYDQVRRYVQTRRLNHRETFIPLEHLPGRRAEADFGHIYADFRDGRRQVPVLVVTWSYSNAPSPWPCRPNAPRPSCTVWSKPLLSLGVCLKNCGGITRQPWPFGSDLVLLKNASDSEAGCQSFPA
jgi:transposase